MARPCLVVLLAAVLGSTCYFGAPSGAAGSELMPETAIAPHGLTRPWFTQVSFDAGRGELRELFLYKGVLYAQTDKAMVHAIDAETGKTLWSAQVGEPKYPSLPPVANRDLLAIVNGSRVYVLNRLNGNLVYQKDTGCAPDGGPALSAKRVYVPMNNGLMVAYPLDPRGGRKPESHSAKPESHNGKKSSPPEEKAAPAKTGQNPNLRADVLSPLYCQSYGQALVQPVVMRENSIEEHVVWPTDRGYLNFAYIDRRAEDAAFDV